MPDMAHSIAYEANVYKNYKLNTWDEESTLPLKDLAIARLPVKGTVPRGYAGVSLSQGTSKEDVLAMLTGRNGGINVPVNGSVPYYYADTEEDRTRATADIQAIPIPITAVGLKKGEELYNIFCAVCHGTAGNFNDGIYASGIYPAAPAILINDEFVASSPGRYYHALMYGKNVMGAYKDKISYEERWNVIHYIYALQAKDRKLKYDEQSNTLNQFAIPASQVVKAAPASDETAAPNEAGGHSTASH